jgi:hypothetical protein
MTDSKFIIEAEAVLPDGGHVRGPVTSVDHKTFLFKNDINDLDFSLEIQRGDLGWFESGNPSAQHHQRVIDEIGVFIDNAIGNSPITNKITLE